MNKAVFLDRDGTIAEDVNYCRRVEDFHILPTVPAAIRVLNNHGYKIVVITNQSGIARGYFSEERLEEIHRKMIHELGKNGAGIDGIYYCRHHPDAGCLCRKPGLVLFRQAVKAFQIDVAASFVIGDRPMDIDAGKALGCRTIYVTTGPDIIPGLEADFTADNLLQAAEWIVRCGNDKQTLSKRKGCGKACNIR